MSKLDNNIINNIKMLSLDMIKEAGHGDSDLALNSALVFQTLFMEHLKFDAKNDNWINRDRVVVSNRFLPVMYSTLHMFGIGHQLDSLRDFKKLNSKLAGFANSNTLGIDATSMMAGDVISTAVGVSLGKRYLESLIKIENPKCNLIDFNTYCICTYEDIISGLSYESLSFAKKEKLNKLIFIVLKDNVCKDSSLKEIYSENLIDNLETLNFDVINIKNNIGAIDDAIDEAKHNKGISVIIVNIENNKDSIRSITSETYNTPLKNEELNTLREKYNISIPFNVDNEIYEEINKHLNKRLNKEIVKWNELKNECLSDLKLKQIIEFLETNNIKIEIKPDNIKINDNYDEELLLGNSKIFNILASKSPFILSGSNDNFLYTKGMINKSDVMSKENPTGRNILFGGRTLALGGISNGLASLGFKVFVNTPLIHSNILRPFIKYSTQNNLDVHYIFTQDTFLNTYEDMGIGAVDEINSLRLIPNLINIRPSDINEIIGMYSILANYKKTTASIIGSEKTKKLIGTNQKYVVAGAYRVRREKGEANGVVIASGSEVSIALKLADELMPYGIDLRVVSMPSQELFKMQSERYRYSLLPKELKTFVIEFGESSLWHKYATDEEYILGLNKYTTSGTKEELLKYYNLDMDSLKTKIIEIMKK